MWDSGSVTFLPEKERILQMMERAEPRRPWNRGTQDMEGSPIQHQGKWKGDMT